MLHIVKKVEYLEGYKLRLHFNNRVVKVVDLENMLKKAKNMLLPLVDIEYFKTVKCDGTTICWPNGVDLCPDVLYAMGKDVKRFERKHPRRSSTLKIRKRAKPKTRPTRQFSPDSH